MPGEFNRSHRILGMTPTAKLAADYYPTLHLTWTVVRSKHDAHHRELFFNNGEEKDLSLTHPQYANEILALGHQLSMILRWAGLVQQLLGVVPQRVVGERRIMRTYGARFRYWRASRCTRTTSLVGRGEKTRAQRAVTVQDKGLS